MLCREQAVASQYPTWSGREEGPEFGGWFGSGPALSGASSPHLLLGVSGLLLGSHVVPHGSVMTDSAHRQGRGLRMVSCAR